MTRLELVELHCFACFVHWTAGGPCKAVAPAYDALARTHPDVLFLKAMEHVVGDLIVQLGVRAFPTFHFYLEGNKVDEVQGGNIAAVEAKVVQHKASVRASFEGAGHSLGGGGPPASEADARAARLARFGGSAASSAPRPAGPHPNAALNAKILAADRGDDGDSGGALSVKPIAAAASAASGSSAAAAMDVDDSSSSAAAAAPSVSNSSRVKS
jgi:thiol-disulfide isomerase/thioredoxin